MPTMIANYINGNLTDARRQAKCYSYAAIRAALVARAGYSLRKAALTAYYLKTGQGWQTACDAD